MKEKIPISTGESRLSATISQGILKLTPEQVRQNALDAAKVVCAFNSIKDRPVDFQRRYR
jgi:hypothetical protein